MAPSFTGNTFIQNVVHFLLICFVLFLREFHSLEIVVFLPDEGTDNKVKNRIRALNVEPTGQLCCLAVR